MKSYQIFGVAEIILSSVILIFTLLFTYAFRLYENLLLLLFVAVYVLVSTVNIKFGLSIYKKKRSITDGVILLSLLFLLILGLVMLLGEPKTQSIY